MSANFLFSNWPAIRIDPLCPGFPPHWAQKGLLEAAGGGVGGGGLELDDPPPQARSTSDVIRNSEKKQTCLAFPNTKLVIYQNFLSADQNAHNTGRISGDIGPTPFM
jgi:hypothetical protein